MAPPLLETGRIERGLFPPPTGATVVTRVLFVRCDAENRQIVDVVKRAPDRLSPRPVRTSQVISEQWNHSGSGSRFVHRLRLSRLRC